MVLRLVILNLLSGGFEIQQVILSIFASSRDIMHTSCIL